MKKDKHNHKATELIKVGLFATLMFAPITAVASSTLYVTFNDNAYMSYQNNTNEDEYIQLDSINQINIGSTYHFISGHEYTNTKGTGPFAISNARNIITQFNHPEYIENAVEMYIYSHENTTQLRVKSATGTQNYINLSTYAIIFDVTIESKPQTTTVQSPEEMLHYLYGIRKGNTNYLTNTFYYAVNQIQEQPIFNWVQNTATYNTIKLVTTGLGTTTQVLPILVAYWFFITVIYIIVDIIIEAAILLTHMITRNN